MIDKVGDYLFDVFGLMLPGIVGITLIIRYQFITVTDIEFISILFEDRSITENFVNHYIIGFFILFITSYLLGNIIKVFSKKFYDLMTSISHDFIMYMCKLIKDIEEFKIISSFKKLIEDIVKKSFKEVMLL